MSHTPRVRRSDASTARRVRSCVSRGFRRKGWVRIRAKERRRGAGVSHVRCDARSAEDRSVTTPALPPSGSNPLAALPSIAIAGCLVTVNPWIEGMVTNIAGNRAIRVVALCGADSPVFHAAHGVRALPENGVVPDRRIIAAHGHLPVLGNLPAERIERFRRRVVLVDATGVTDSAAIVRSVADAVLRAAALPLLPAASEPDGERAEPTFERIPRAVIASRSDSTPRPSPSSRWIAWPGRASVGTTWRTTPRRMRFAPARASAFCWGSCAPSWSRSSAMPAISAPSSPRPRRLCGSDWTTSRTDG
jgi:hypothetical protein